MFWIIFANESKEGTRKKIKDGYWEFKTKIKPSYQNRRWERKGVRPPRHHDLKTGDFVLFYLSNESKDGGSIIATATLDSRFLDMAIYTERNGKKITVKKGVILHNPDVNFFKKIDPNKYGIGGHRSKGIFIIPIKHEQYHSIVSDV